MKIKLPRLSLLLKRSYFCALCLTSISFYVSSVEASATKDSLEQSVIVSPKLKKKPKIRVPSKLKKIHLENPSVLFNLRINEKGKIVDSVCLYATHHGLLKSAEKALRKLKFKPGTENGVPIVHDLILSIPCQTATVGKFVGSNAMDDIKNTVYKLQKQKVEYKKSLFEELDKPLELVQEGQVFIPKTDDGTLVSGAAELEFYIDYNGNARMPKILRSDHPEISEASLLIIKDMKFTKPSHSSLPTLIKVQLPFIFKAGEIQLGAINSGLKKGES